MNIPEFVRKSLYRLKGRVVSLRTHKPRKGTVLLSYTIHPFIADADMSAHTSYWEAREMTAVFLARGYDVDVIDWQNTSFVPKREYDVFIDIHANMERLAPLLPKKTKKIFHATNAHWLFQNEAEYSRLLDLQKRRGRTLFPERALSPTRGPECADSITVLGNDFTKSTYEFADKEIVSIPLSTTHTFPFDETKDLERVKKNFLWFGGAGAVHKGVDLVLEAFAGLPDHTLTLCGKLDREKDFMDTYARELSLPNITYAGWVDAGSEKFKTITREAVGMVYPSCSEGGGGSVLLAMHAGLIPIVSYEASVDTEDFGVVLSASSVEAIQEAVRSISRLDSAALRVRSQRAWQYANEHHTKEAFTKAYGSFVDQIINP